MHNHMGKAMDHHITTYPAIRAAAVAIAYDNGMVNRDCTEANFLARASKALDGLTTDDLIGIDITLASLPQHQLETLCSGEEQEQRAILAGRSYATQIHQLLENFFDA